MIYIRFIFFALLLSEYTAASAVSVGENSPDCLLESISPHKDIVKLEHPTNKVLYVDFWASWCAPCAKSFPFMNHLNRQFEERGLQIIAINLDENPDDIIPFLRRFPASFSIVRDKNQQCAKAFSVQAMPSTYLIDKQGRVRYIHLGFRPSETTQMLKIIQQLLDE